MPDILIFLFILGVLVVVHEFGHFIVAKKLKVKVERFSFGFGPCLLKKKKGGTEYCVSAVPLGGYVKLSGDSLQEFKGAPDEYLARPCGQRAMIVLFGPLLNYILGFLCFWFIFFAGYPALTARVGGVMDGFGAKDAGMLAGDRIIAVEGIKVNLWEELQTAVKDRKEGDRVRVLVMRDGTELAFDVKIKQQQLSDATGRRHSVGLIGISPAEEVTKVRHGPVAALFLGITRTWDLTRTIYRTLWSMLTGRLSFKESVTGPLGIFYITSQAAHLGITPLLFLVAGLSISLAVFNLLPFPVLDGGHIFLLGVEKVRGKAIGQKAEQLITQIGMAALILLAAIVTYNDILRFFGGRISGWFIK